MPKPNKSPAQLGRAIDASFASLSLSIFDQSWSLACNEALGPSKPFPGFIKINAYSFPGAYAARSILDSISSTIDLPPLPSFDFWIRFGDLIQSKLSFMALYEVNNTFPPHSFNPQLNFHSRLTAWSSLPETHKALALLKDFYPFGPRYVTPNSESLI